MNAVIADPQQFFPLTAARKKFPGTPSASTVWRWATQGVGGCKLKTWTIGGRTFTNDEACSQFVEATSKAHEAVA